MAPSPVSVYEAGSTWGIQVRPPLVVATTSASGYDAPLGPTGGGEMLSPPPTAQQSRLVGQEMPSKPLPMSPRSAGAGSSWYDQERPPLVVVATAPNPLESVPTAQQSDVFGHDTPLRSQKSPAGSA